MPRKMLFRFILPLAVILVGFGVYSYFKPPPAVEPVRQIVSVPKTAAINLPWPGGGQAAIGAGGYGLLASHNTSSPVPIASIAKIITALAILKQKPISAGAQGATITFDSADVAFFNSYYTKDGSVEPVSDGEQITEVQGLQAMLLPSANNIADSMARWAFGSVDNYVSYANKMVKDMGLVNTRVGDASGFGDNTTSTADDLVKLGIAAINNPSIAQVVGQTSAQIPVAGMVNNLNFLLGQDGVIGIKTGNTDKAGGCYLFAAERHISGNSIKIVGAILAQPDLVSALRAALPIIRASDAGFTQVTVLHKGEALGYYQAPWGAISKVAAAKDLRLFAWKGSDINVSSDLDSIKAPTAAGSKIGNVTVHSNQQSASTDLLLSQDLPGPSWHWRIFR